MAGGMDLGTSGGRGGKKPLDMSVNLVPFIDLMAVTISFLVMTAVWTQLGRLEVSQSGAGPTTQTQDTPPPPEVALLLTREEVQITLGGAPIAKLSASDALTGANAKLIEVLRTARNTNMTAAHVTLTAEDDVTYDALVHTIDACIAAGLPDVTVSTS